MVFAKGWLSLALGVFGMVGTTALAQPTLPEHPDAILVAEPTEQLAYVAGIQAEVATVAEQLETLLERPDEAGECLVVRVAAAQALTRVTRNSQSALASAHADNDSEQAHHELRKAVVARDKSRTLRNEALACLDGTNVTTEAQPVAVSENAVKGKGFEELEAYFFDRDSTPPSVSPFR